MNDSDTIGREAKKMTAIVTIQRSEFFRIGHKSLVDMNPVF